MNASDIRAVRDELRLLHARVLDEIADIVVAELDRLAEEAVVWGASDQHDFRTDAAAAGVIKQIAIELERATTTIQRRLGRNR